MSEKRGSQIRTDRGPAVSRGWAPCTLSLLRPDGAALSPEGWCWAQPAPGRGVDSPQGGVVAWWLCAPPLRGPRAIPMSRSARRVSSLLCVAWLGTRGAGRSSVIRPDLREVTMRRVGVMGTVSGRSGYPALPSGEGRACHTTSDGPYLCAVSPSSELFMSFLSLLPERCEHQHARQTTARCQVTRAVKTSSPESRLWAGAAVWAASRRSLRWSALRIWGLSRLPHPWGPGLSWLGQETG